MVQNSPVQIIAFQKQRFMLFIGHCLQHQWTVQGENVLIRYELNWEWHGWVLILVLPQAFPFLFCVYSHASRYWACYPFTKFHNTTFRKKDRFPSFFLNGGAASDVHLPQMWEQKQQSRRAGLCLAPSTGHPCYWCDLFLMVFLFAGICIYGGYSGLWNLTWHLFFWGTVRWQEADADFFGVLSLGTPTSFPSPLNVLGRRNKLIRWNGGVHFHRQQEKHAGKRGWARGSDWRWGRRWFV